MLPVKNPQPKDGRPWISYRQAMDGIFYVLRTGCQWKALPRTIGATSTVHDRFQQWVKAGVFRRLWEAGVLEYEALKGIDREWQAMDGAKTKAPQGGKRHRSQSHRPRQARHEAEPLTEGYSIPLAEALEGANRHDMKLVPRTLDTMVIRRPESTAGKPQHLCRVRGYDHLQVRELVAVYGYTAHIRARGEKVDAKKHVPGYRARRWMVERTHSWLNRFRRLLIRWEKNVENYLAFLHFACAWITFRAAWDVG